MRVRSFLVLCGLMLVLSCAPVEAGAATVAPLAIKATDVTMPSVTVIETSGGGTLIHMGASRITVTGIPEDGNLEIKCWYSGPTTKAKIPPQCGPIGLRIKPVTAGKAFYGTVTFVPYDQGHVPGVDGFLQPRRAPTVSSHLAAAALTLAGALMLGFGFRRNRLRWLTLTVFVVCVVAGALESSASGRKFNPMTQGTYQYTISADFKAKSGATAGQSASTNIMLTVK